MRKLSALTNFDDQLSPYGSSELEMVYDDEPIENALYGKAGRGSTPVSLFAQSRKYLESIRAANGKSDVQAVIDAASALAASGSLISIGACFELAGILVRVVPQTPNPVIAFDLLPLRSLLETIWQIAVEKQDISLQKRIAYCLYRWYEHHKHYEKARNVLARQIAIYRSEKDHSAEAIARNNWAFELFLEGRYLEAIPEFESSARLFEEIGKTEQAANSLVNCWVSRFEAGDFDSILRAEPELESLAAVLDKAGMWHARKPLVLLARIAESRGDIRKAIALVQRAIRACKDTGTLYPKMDGQYLAHLCSLKD